MADIARRDVDVGDGLTLHAAVSGHGPPIVLLHGFTGSGETWVTLRSTLESSRTVVTIDLPGHGRSTAPVHAARYRLRRLADDLARVLDALALGQAAFLGYSLGGRAALHFAAAHADRLTALVVESSSPGIADEGERAARRTSDAELAEAIERGGIQAFVDHWEALPLWASQAALPDVARAALRTQRLANDPRGLATSLCGAGAGAEPALGAELRTVTVPALVIAGALDLRYVDFAQMLAGLLPGARMVTVPGTGHAVHLEQPAAFASLVREFLDNFDR